jgi:hypothetical protein
MLRLGVWFAAFMTAGVWACRKWGIDIPTNGIAIGAGILALLAAGVSGRGGHKQHHR